MTDWTMISHLETPEMREACEEELDALLDIEDHPEGPEAYEYLVWKLSYLLDRAKGWGG